jgi:protein tyrosine/serine phosphatase
MYRALHQSGLARRAVSARLLVITTLLINLACLPAPAQLNGSSEISIKNFGKVNENYYRGSQPVGGQFAELKRLGVKTVIDLRGDRLREAEGQARAQGLSYFNIPLTTKRAATEEQTVYFLKLVNDPANRPVYVHCKGGRHRTGEMTALYRITNDGWTADEAYAEMKKYDFEDSFFYPRSLKKYVFEFYKRFSADKASRGQAAGQAAGILR